MSTMKLTREGTVRLLTLTNGERANTFTADVLAEYEAVLDELEAAEGNTALVLTSSDPKFWCNGIDLEWLLTQPPESFLKLAAMMERMLLRMALLNMPTIGCITGHAYAGGAILAAALDFRLMRAERGFFCFSEVDVKIPFSPVLYEIIRRLSEPATMRELLLTGRRLTGQEALAAKVVSAIHPAESLFPKAMELAEALSRKDRATYAAIKRGMKRRMAELQKSLGEQPG
jgi:enoyl-CoA hydratase/carnithine racemase